VTTGPDAPPLTERTVALPFDPGSARTARRVVTRMLAPFSPPQPLVDDALLVVHELVVNGVTHGRPGEQNEIEVHCALFEAWVHISVRDHGTTGTVAPRRPSAGVTNGRGLLIVAAIATRWSVDRRAGTRVEAWLAR